MIVAALVLASSCTNDGGESSAACLPSFDYYNRRYTSLNGYASKDQVTEIGTGYVPACSDTNHSAGEKGFRVRVARIDGVCPSDSRGRLARGSLARRRAAGRDDHGPTGVPFTRIG